MKLIHLVIKGETKIVLLGMNHKHLLINIQNFQVGHIEHNNLCLFRLHQVQDSSYFLTNLAFKIVSSLCIQIRRMRIANQ